MRDRLDRLETIPLDGFGVHAFEPDQSRRRFPPWRVQIAFIVDLRRHDETLLSILGALHRLN